MRNRGWNGWGAALCLIVLALAGCDGRRRSAETEATRIVEGMPLEVRISQLIAPTLSPADTASIRRLRVEARSARLPALWIDGGDATALRRWITRIRAESSLPILVLGSIDSGVPVAGATRFPMLLTAAAADDSEIGAIADAIASEAVTVGLDLGFIRLPPTNSGGPLHPLARNAAASGEVMARLADEIADRDLLVGVDAYWTDVPGDPVLGWDRARLDAIENTILDRSMDGDVAAIRPGSLRLPAITGDSLPFALSRIAISGLVRRDLGVREPLVVVDVSPEGRLSRRYGEGAAIVRAIAAGADLVVGVTDTDSARAAILAAIGSGTIPRERVDSAAVRVLAARIHRAAGRPRLTGPDTTTLQLRSPEHIALAERLRRARSSEWAAGSDAPMETPDSIPGMDDERLDRIDELMVEAMEDGVFGAAALAIGRRGQLVRFRGYGPVDPERTIFDLASLTKVVATTTAAAILVERGALELDAPVREYVSEWTGGAKGDVTIRHLLTHTSGLPAGVWLFGSAHSPEDAIRRTLDQPLSREPGASVEYSDLGMIILAEAIERAAGVPLDRFLAREVYAPLGMHGTMFLPPTIFSHRIIPTALTNERNFTLQGIVHDANAFRLGGVTGHAGLFSTARDLAIFAQMMLGGGAYGSTRILQESTVREFTRRQPNAGTRALGWDTPADRSSAGSLFSAESFGHTGYTGTSIWIDPALDLYVVLLTNRTFSGGSASDILRLRSDIHYVAADAVTDVEVERREGARPVR